MLARRVVSAVAGSMAAIALWLLLLPWDLSEVDAGGRAIEGGGDANGPALALVLFAVAAAGTGLALFRPATATTFTAAVTLTYVSLFAWRVGGSRTSGANLWLVPFVMVVLPAALASWVVVSWLTRRRRHAQASPRT